ncbi:hypothetical protein A9Q83_15025 [Alphaproteobacteria bacterium 46_93_T64]|nr:hypothetical protein A9Q83_15025 [Alphaproteobacteria bacterium 46_93_T64]
MKTIKFIVGFVAICTTLTATNALATAVQVGGFDATYTADDTWFKSDMRAGGTAEIVDLTGLGGNLETNQPLPTGVAKLTTGASNSDKAEVSIIRDGGHYGTIGDFLTGGMLSYDYHKQGAGDLNPSATAAIKFTVLDLNTTQSDGYTTFVFEPTWNLGTPGTSVVTPTDTWTQGTVTGSAGILWHTGLYGAGNLAGNGSNGNTLSDWVGVFGDDLLDAFIVGISVGVGTYNQGQTAFFDNVKYLNGAVDLAYDFQPSVVPLPAALPLYGAGLAVMGLVGLRKRKAKVAA